MNVFVVNDAHSLDVRNLLVILVFENSLSFDLLAGVNLRRSLILASSELLPLR